MGSLGLLFRRELGSYFASAMAYVVFTSFLLISGWFFVGYLNMYEQSRLPLRFGETLSTGVLLLVFFCPLITMRLLAEEKSRGTLETLLTAPITATQIVLAKFFASVVFMNYLLVIPIIGYGLLLSFYISIDPGLLLSSYVGVMLAGSAIFSIGLFISSLCQNQMSAGIVTLMVVVLLLVVRFTFPAQEDTLLYQVLARIDLMGGIESFYQGVIDSRDVVYYFSVILFFLYATIHGVESKRWR